MNLSTIEAEEIEIFYDHIAKNVKKYRLQKGFSQMELALAIGIKSIAFFSNAENHKNDKHFNLEHLYKIAKVLELPLYLFLEE